MARSTFVYVAYIRTTPEKLWSAMTDDAEFIVSNLKSLLETGTIVLKDPASTVVSR